MPSNEMSFGKYAAHKVRTYLTRMANMPVACRVAFMVLVASYLNAVLSIAMTVACGVYVICNRECRKDICSDNNNLISLGLCALFIGVSFFNRNYVGILAMLFFTFLVFIMTSVRKRITRRFFEDLVTAHLTYSVFAVIVAFIEWCCHLSAPIYRSASTFLNPLYFSYFIAISAVMATYRLVVSPRARLVHGFVLLIDIFGMLLSGGRLPWIGMFAGCLAVLIFCRKYKLFVLFSIAICFMIGFAAMFPNLPILESLRLGSIGAGYEERIPYWKLALEGFEKSPFFGQGILGVLNLSLQKNPGILSHIFDANGGLATAMESLKYSRNVPNGLMLHAHNILFDMLCNLGIIGSIIFMFCLVRYLTNMYSKFDYKSNQPMIALMVGFICAVTVNSILDCQFIGAQTMAFTVILFSATGLKKEKGYDDLKNELTLQEIREHFSKKIHKKISR